MWAVTEVMENDRVSFCTQLATLAKQQEMQWPPTLMSVAEDREESGETMVDSEEGRAAEDLYTSIM